MEDVTFLLPAYNEEKSIGPLLDNIKRLYPNSRILVVDNNSDDGTEEIAKKVGAYLRLCAFIRSSEIQSEMMYELFLQRLEEQEV